jgi:NAD(P)H-hydrate epimerase
MELMYEPVAASADGHFAQRALRKIKEIWQDKSVIALGPGIGVTDGIRRLVASIIKEAPRPLVIDADGINALVGQLSALKAAHVPIVITPHPGEMARLLEISTQKLQAKRLYYARSFAREQGITVVLKGYRTLSAFPDGKVYINPTGNPAMASAGMGDVLTGIIAGFLAQGLDWVEAITSAVYLHGLTGDRLAARMGDRGVLAGDLIDALPFVMKDFVPTRPAGRD